MKASDLNDAMQYIRDEYLDMGDAPILETMNHRFRKEIMEMSTKKHGMKRFAGVLVIAATIAALAITAYAADFLQVKSLVTSTVKTYDAYQQIKKAEKEAGYTMKAKERFESGYCFDMLRVNDTRAEDENGKEVLTYKEISIIYSSDAGGRLMLFTTPDLELIPHTEHEVMQKRDIEGIPLQYYVDNYRTYPDGYQLSEEEKRWEQQPGNFVSYMSSDEEMEECGLLEETSVAFLNWTQDGTRYTIMDPRGNQDPEILFAMAEELIRS